MFQDTSPLPFFIYYLPLFEFFPLLISLINTKTVTLTLISSMVQ